MSCDDVCVTGNWDGSNDFYSEKRPRARKAHACDECGDTIAAGDVYFYASGKSDGDFWDARTCLSCDEIGRAFVCEGRMFTTLWEDIREQLFPRWNEMVAIDCLAKLTSDAAVAKMRAQHATWTASRPWSRLPVSSDQTTADRRQET